MQRSCHLIQISPCDFYLGREPLQLSVQYESCVEHDGARRKRRAVRLSTPDRMAIAVMAELGQDIAGHRPITFEELDDWEGLNFDLIITLSPEAHHKALELTRTLAADVEYWPTHDPTGAEGNREQKLQAYREVCDELLLRIRKRFSKVGAASG